MLGLGDLDVRALLADRSLPDWLGIGLLAVGGYLVLSWLVPGIRSSGRWRSSPPASACSSRTSAAWRAPWALYAGAVLTGMGAARVLGDLLPGAWHGATAIGIGVAFLAIGYLRHTQAGGYGWQGVVGGAALAPRPRPVRAGLAAGRARRLDLIMPLVLLGAGGCWCSVAGGRAAARRTSALTQERACPTWISSAGSSSASSPAPCRRWCSATVPAPAASPRRSSASWAARWAGCIARKVFDLDQTQGFLGALFVAFLGAVLLRFLIALVTPRR